MWNSKDDIDFHGIREHHAQPRVSGSTTITSPSPTSRGVCSLSSQSAYIARQVSIAHVAETLWISSTHRRLYFPDSITFEQIFEHGQNSLLDFSTSSQMTSISHEHLKGWSSTQTTSSSPSFCCTTDRILPHDEGILFKFNFRQPSPPPPSRVPLNLPLVLPLVHWSDQPRPYRLASQPLPTASLPPRVPTAPTASHEPPAQTPQPQPEILFLFMWYTLRLYDIPTSLERGVSTTARHRQLTVWTSAAARNLLDNILRSRRQTSTSPLLDLRTTTSSKV